MGDKNHSLNSTVGSNLVRLAPAGYPSSDPIRKSLICVQLLLHELIFHA